MNLVQVEIERFEIDNDMCLPEGNKSLKICLFTWFTREILYNRLLFNLCYITEILRFL